MVKFDEKSCGVVLFRLQNNQRHYLLLQYPQGHWSFIKGHVENDESEHQTALRELQEETQIIDAKILDGFKHEISYTYKHHHTGQPSHKQVVYFLAQTQTAKVQLSHEHQKFLWLPQAEVSAKLTYDNAKNLFEKVKTFLQ